MNGRLSIEQHVITADAAHAAVHAAVTHGRALGCAMVAAIVDPAGNLVAFLREPGAFLHSIGIATDKAYTAASFGMPTADLYALAESNIPLRDGLTRRDRMVMFAGGFPIRDHGRLIGAIGVSGGTETQDCACAQAGLAAILTVEAPR
jgi:glc operon protein GlcG